MRLLAADLTAFESSLAFHQDGVVLEEVRWRTEPGRHQDFFVRLREGLGRHGWRVSDLDALVAGRGPGNFSGMRTCLTAFAAMALPHGIPLRAVSSGRAIAARVFHERPAAPVVAVVGDARRDALWGAWFPRPEAGFIPAIAPYERIAVSEALARLGPAPVVASPDASRLAASLGLSWFPTDLAPGAAWLAHIAAEEIAAHQPGEPAEALYLHPPVREPAPGAA